MTRKEAFGVDLPNAVILRFEDGLSMHYQVSDDCMNLVIHELAEQQTIAPKGARLSAQEGPWTFTFSDMDTSFKLKKQYDAIEKALERAREKMTRKEAFEVDLPNTVILRFEDGLSMHYQVSDDCINLVIHELSEQQTIAPQGARLGAQEGPNE